MTLNSLGPSSSVDVLFGLQAEAVLRLVDPGRSSYVAWSGNTGVLDTDRPEDANTPWAIGADQSIRYDDGLVREPLQRLIDAGLAGRRPEIDGPLDLEMLTRGKAAAFFVAQANLQRMTPGGEPWRAPGDPGEEAVEDAFTDAGALDVTDDLATSFGLDSSAGDLRRINLRAAFADQSSELYGHLSPGVRAAYAVAEYAGERSDLTPSDVLKLVNRQTAAGKADTLVGLLLKPVGDEVDTSEVRADLARTLHSGFAGLGDPTGRELVADLQQDLAWLGLDTARERAEVDPGVEGEAEAEAEAGPADSEGVQLTADLWQRQDELTLAVTGADRSSWNHVTAIGHRTFTAQQVHESFSRYTIGPDPGAPGNGELEGRRAAVQPTGTIRYRPDVVRDVEELHAAAGRDDFSDAELTRWRTSLRAVLQANWELHGPDGQDYDGQLWPRHEIDPIQRGRAEAGAGAATQLDEFTDRLSLPENLTAALKGVRPEYDDPVGTAAWVALSEGLANELRQGSQDGSGPIGTDVLRQLNNRGSRDSLAAVARLALAARPLALPESHPLRQATTDIAVDRIQQTLHLQLGGIASATAQAERDGAATPDQLHAGARIGERATGAVRDAIEDLNATLAEPAGAQQLQAAHLAGVDAPPMRRRSAARDQGTTAGPEVGSRPALHVPSAAWPGMAPNKPDQVPYR